MRYAARSVVAALFLSASSASPAFGQGDAQPVYVTADAVAVRFHAPDMGGPAHPHFITARQLSFEARLYALEEDPSGVVQLRHVRSAIESHIAEEMLESLPLEHAPDAAAIAKTVETFRASIEQRVGGHAAIERAEKLEGIEPLELEAIFQRQARAALYIDRALSPILVTTEDQLSETYRTTSHPFRGRHLDDVRDELGRWIVVERFRSAEQSYLQAARARVTVVYF